MTVGNNRPQVNPAMLGSEPGIRNIYDKHSDRVIEGQESIGRVTATVETPKERITKIVLSVLGVIALVAGIATGAIIPIIGAAVLYTLIAVRDSVKVHEARKLENDFAKDVVKSAKKYRLSTDFEVFNAEKEAAEAKKKEESDREAKMNAQVQAQVAEALARAGVRSSTTAHLGTFVRASGEDDVLSHFSGEA